MGCKNQQSKNNIFYVQIKKNKTHLVCKKPLKNLISLGIRQLWWKGFSKLQHSLFPPISNQQNVHKSKETGAVTRNGPCVPLTCAFFSRSVKTENQSGVSASSSKVMMAKANVEPLNCQSWWQAIQCCTCLVHNTAWQPGGVFWSKAGFAVGWQPAPELSPMDEMRWGWPETSRAWNWTGEERGSEEERDQNVSHVTSLLSWCLSILLPTSASNMSGHQTSYYSHLTNNRHIIYLWVKLPHFGSSLSSGVCCSVPPGFHGFDFMTVAIKNARRRCCRSSFKSSGIFKTVKLQELANLWNL